MHPVVRGRSAFGLVVSSLILLSALAVFIGSGVGGGTKAAEAGDLATMMRVLHGMQAPDARGTVPTEQPGVPRQATSSADYFLAIDGIEGDSTANGYEGQIDVLSFSWGASSSSPTPTSAGGRAGRVSFDDFQFTLPISVASPELFVATATGRQIPQAVLTVRRSSAEQQEYMQITLTAVVVTSYRSAADGGDPTDAISLRFGTVEFEYRPPRADGTLGTPMRTGFDLQANREM